MISKIFFSVTTLMVLSACTETPQNDVRAEPVVDNAASVITSSAAEKPRFTKEEFRSTIQPGMSKAQVREKLGRPSNVIDQSGDNLEHWYFWDRDLTVVDPDAGVTVASTTVTFFADTGLVREVSF